MHIGRLDDMKRTLQALTGVIALYAVVRGIAELFLIDYPRSLLVPRGLGRPVAAGGAAVHAGPGLALLASGFVWLRRHRRHVRPGTLSRS